MDQCAVSRGGGSKINWPFCLQACRRRREGKRAIGREKRRKVEGRGEKREKETAERRKGGLRECTRI